jgi:ketosteroid isomerase-like protein
MHPIIKKYLVAFAAKDLDTLAEVYHDNVVLWEWGEHIFMGKQNVLNANKQLFSGTENFGVVIQSNGSVTTADEDRHMVEMSILFDNKMISVVDVITIYEDKIFSIQAYRGF